MQALSRPAAAALFASVLLLCAAQATAQPAYRVKDIDTSVELGSLNLIGGFGGLGSILVFGASSIGNPEQLWRSDGTRDGTFLIRNIHPEGYGSPNTFVSLGNAQFFFTNGTELWKTDGTTAGTALVKTFVLVSGYPLPRELIAMNDALFFVANDGAHGDELWRSDGTTQGTTMVADLLPGPNGSAPSSLTLLDNTVHFFAGDDTGSSLWKSDGTEAGTVRIAEIDAGRYPSSLTSSDSGSLFYLTQQATNDVVSYSLWSSDGTTEGTALVRDFAADYPGVCPGFCFPYGPSGLTPLPGNRVALIGDDGVHGIQLWSSDGTAAGTSMLLPGPGFVVSGGLVRFGDAVYLVATDGVHGYELWKTDGTSAGTKLFKDLVPGAADGNPWGMTVFGEELFFSAAGGSYLAQLWSSDGTQAGTRSLKDVALSTNGYGVFTPTDGALFFLGAAGPETGLWTTDGTENGTVFVSDFATGRGSHPIPAVDFGGRLLFTVQDDPITSPSPRTTLWQSDGTENGTSPVLPFSTLGGGPFSSSRMVQYRGSVFFAGDEGIHGPELWKTDGTPEGTSLLKDIWPGFMGSGPYELGVAGDKLFFAAWDGEQGGLWTTDGTEAGTRRVSPVVPTGERFEPVALGHLLVFLGDDGVHGGELWRSDGTDSGTFMIKDINPGAGWPAIYRIASAGGKEFFAGWDGVTNSLWATDGTESGTAPLASFDSVFGTDLTAVGDLVFFTNYGQTELWRSDGTPQGTFVAKAVAASNLVDVGGTLFFSGDDGVHGMELWRSDGTADGTTMVADSNPGSFGSSPTGLTAIDGTLLFAAADADHGSELWHSDGTLRGTEMIQDIAPGTYSSSPSGFTKSGDLVFFSADDGSTGTELWAIPVEALRPRRLVDAIPSPPRPTSAVVPRH